MSKKEKKKLKQILLAVALFLALLILDKTHSLPDVFDHRWLSFIYYLVPYAICGADVVKKAVLGVIHRQPFDECFLMTIATIGAFVTGENSEAVAVMAFYQVGEWFQSYALGKSRKSITDLMDIVPEFANVEREDGEVETVDPDDVEIGDTLVIRPGERIPVDGTVLQGSGMVNTAALTGESVPRSVHPGEQIISGCINGESVLRVRADKEFDDSTVSKILEMVETASERKSRTESFITRFARYYTPIVVFCALALVVAGSIVTRQPATWVYRACTFLVISCPCALVISVPLAFFGGIGAASAQGVLVKGSNYLEQMAKLDTVVSDKTGTLTKGNFAVVNVIPAAGVEKSEVLAAAACAEGFSTHPIAKSIREAYRQSEHVASSEFDSGLTDTENISGQGLMAVTESGHKILVGNDRLMGAKGIDYVSVSENAATVSYVAMDGKYLGAILIADEIKPEVPEAVREMKACGVGNVVMLTGDRQAVGEAVGTKLGLDKVYAELLPQDKVAKVEEMLDGLGGDKQRKLAFIGDGINDAPVLSRADVGIAMGSLGSDAAIEAADIVIMDDDLRKIPTVIRIARRTVSISTQNIVFALVVKILILILGAVGVANMWAAVFADVGVAVICILNSMRMLRRKK